MSYYEHKGHEHVCENCGSQDTNVRSYYTLDNKETVYHCNSCGYIHWNDQFRD